MIAHFYLLAESFQNNSNFSKVQVEEKIKRFSEDVSLIDNYKDTNFLYVNYEEVYPQILYSIYTIEDIICNGYNLKSEGYIERDVFNAIQNIFINKAQETTSSFQEVRDNLIPQVNESICYGLIAFHTLADFDSDLQIIYGINDWYRFRRYILSLYPTDGNFFIDECIKYYPNLLFHNRNKDTITSILKDCAKKIINYLSELNDKFNQAKTTPYDRKRSLSRFNSMCSFDIEASDEGNSGSKKKSKVKMNDTFDFTDKNNNPVSVCCDLHLKILKNDYNKISTDRRIYFSEPNERIDNSKILIGHIGSHR